MNNLGLGPDPNYFPQTKPTDLEAKKMFAIAIVWIVTHIMTNFLYIFGEENPKLILVALLVMKLLGQYSDTLEMIMMRGS